jgi:hypothetical protein
MTLGPISHQTVVEAAPALAFHIFAAHLGAWWPIAYTFSGPSFANAVVQPHAGGRWYEISDAGETLSWGDVRVFDAGVRLVLGFAIGADRRPAPTSQASEVEVRFLPEGASSTRVEIEHRAFEQHAAGAETLREGMDSPQGWPLILAEFRRHVRLRRARTDEEKGITPAM